MKQTAFASSPPPEANGIEFRPFSFGSPKHGAEIIVPHTNGHPYCPVCGNGPDPETTFYLDLQWDSCPQCWFAWGEEDGTPYDDTLDSVFGGQLGSYRKEWLDRTGWQERHLRQIEHVFQISTNDWQRD